jgi:endonuclease YncB( thermonuclease family)
VHRFRLPALAALVLIVLAFSLPALAAGPRASSAGVTGAVPATLVDVIDGDTIDVLVNGKLERVRYIGIDAPERGQPGFRAATEVNQKRQAGPPPTRASPSPPRRSRAPARWPRPRR